MIHELIKTSDGSTSLYIPQLDETYHSVHGALQETQHVFIKNGLQLFETINDVDTFDLIYFDAFGAQVQPELWQEAIFQQMYTALKQGGYLVTYAAKGSVRRAMQACGFTVERLSGPPMKREMLRAHKN